MPEDGQEQSTEPPCCGSADRPQCLGLGVICPVSAQAQQLLPWMPEGSRAGEAGMLCLWG